MNKYLLEMFRNYGGNLDRDDEMEFDAASDAEAIAYAKKSTTYYRVSRILDDNTEDENDIYQ